MTIALVQSGTADTAINNVSTVDTVFASDVTVGNLIGIVCTKFDPGFNGFVLANLSQQAGTAVLTDIQLHATIQVATDTKHSAAVWTARVVTGGSCTMRVSSTAGSYFGLSRVELSSDLGWITTREEDTDATSGNATPQVGGNMTSSGAAAFLGGVAVVAGVNVPSLAIDPAFTSLYLWQDGSISEACAHMLQIVAGGTTDAIESSSTSDGAFQYAAVGVVLREGTPNLLPGPANLRVGYRTFRPRPFGPGRAR